MVGEENIIAILSSNYLKQFLISSGSAWISVLSLRRISHKLEFELRMAEGLHQQVPDDDDALILSFWLLGLAPSSLGLQELASQVGSIN